MKQNNMAFSKSLEKRTKQFTIRIYKLVGQFEYFKSNEALDSQLFRSASSIGANYREANRSKSRADFRNKIRICEFEASETNYWLEIIEESGLVEKALISACLSEANEFLAIFTTISNKLNSKLG